MIFAHITPESRIEILIKAKTKDEASAFLHTEIKWADLEWMDRPCPFPLPYTTLTSGYPQI